MRCFSASQTNQYQGIQGANRSYYLAYCPANSATTGRGLPASVREARTEKKVDDAGRLLAFRQVRLRKPGRSLAVAVVHAPQVEAFGGIVLRMVGSVEVHCMRET